MIAVTVWAGNSSDTSWTARGPPTSAVRCSVARRRLVVADATIALARHPARRDRDDQDESHQYERRRPRQPVPLVEWTGGVDVDLERQRLHRMGDRDRKVQI